MHDLRTWNPPPRHTRWVTTKGPQVGCSRPGDSDYEGFLPGPRVLGEDFYGVGPVLVFSAFPLGDQWGLVTPVPFSRTGLGLSWTSVVGSGVPSCDPRRARCLGHLDPSLPSGTHVDVDRTVVVSGSVKT